MTLYSELTALESEIPLENYYNLWHYCDPSAKALPDHEEGNRGKRHVTDSVCSEASRNLSGKWEA